MLFVFLQNLRKLTEHKIVPMKFYGATAIVAAINLDIILQHLQQFVSIK